MKTKNIVSTFVLAAVVAGLAFADGDLPTDFLNRNSVANTRHNMTQRQPSSSQPAAIIMDTYRNNYGEVCVYCHTPHGANTKVELPLWNRTMKATTYTTYNQLGTTSLTQPVAQPGVNSLACLSCHDGQTAIDSIINMPGSGRYLASQEDGVSNTFLTAWTNPFEREWGEPGASGETFAHLTLTECLACHSSGAGFLGAGAADFSAAAIGTDLRNDHPVGITFPAASGAGTDWKEPNGSITKGTKVAKFFDENPGNGRMDKTEIRLFDSSGGAAVECASCHDPHGVPSGGTGSVMIPTFLRKPNSNSALCMTCHNK